MRNNNEALANLLRAKDGLVYVVTYEENEVVEDICACVRHTNQGKPPKVYVYSLATGLYEVDLLHTNSFSQDKVVKEVKSLHEALEFVKNLQFKQGPKKNALLQRIQRETPEKNNRFASQDEGAVFIFKDLHLHFNPADKVIIRTLRDLKESYKQNVSCPVFITAPVVELPPELEKLVTLYEYPLLTTEEIKAQKLQGLMQTLGASEEQLEQLAMACTGLTNREIDRALAHSLVKNNKQAVLAEDIHEEKLQIVQKSGALDWLEPHYTLEDLGGCANFKEWIKRTKVALTPEAQAFGLPKPKGCMLVGLPGTSKTASAEILASYLGVPLLSLNMAKIMGSLVGMSERQISNALRIAQAISPCVLLIDECEKGFSGVNSSASCDAGTLSRVMSQLLSFLQQEDTGVITVMTSNDVSILPPELTRSGRIDAQFVFNLPTLEERLEIIGIYLRKQQLKLEPKLVDYLAKETEHFTGAEIKNVVQAMVLNSFYRQYNAGSTPTRTVLRKDIEQALANSVIVYNSNREKIQAFMEYAKDRYLDASMPASGEAEPEIQLMPKLKKPKA